MKAYLSVFRLKTMALMQYRTAAAAKLAPPLFVGLVMAQVYRAFYAGTSAAQPLSLAQTITYCWIVQLLVHIQPWSGDPEVLRLIRDGNIAYELCRPLDLCGQWFSRLAARRLVPLALDSIPLALIALFLIPTPYRMGRPASVCAALAFVLAVIGAVLMSSALSNILGILTIWTISGEGLYFLMPVFFMILSGANVPLPLFPPALRALVEILPFRALIDTPAQAYLGLIAPTELVRLLATQLAWTLGFVLLGRFLLARALRSVVIQGG
jgi:ABC-2 type transport system permease protein